MLDDGLGESVDRIDGLPSQRAMTPAAALEGEAPPDRPSSRVRPAQVALRRLQAQRAMMPATTRTAGASRQMAKVLAIAIGASAYDSV